ncbi:hypothetical protein GCM10010245_51440 [Streptomyces spectabilis]|nr:hypothetical protein GCM10010245_51440 [Streptomyces spectabilis]
MSRGVSAADALGAVAASVAVAASATVMPRAVRGVEWGTESLPVGVGTEPAQSTGAVIQGGVGYDGLTYG